jgi:hypothetical protein
MATAGEDRQLRIAKISNLSAASANVPWVL